MFAENRENAKYDLQGRVLKSFFVIFSSYISFCIFVLSIFFCLYLLIVNTDLLGDLGVFDNQYIHAAVCAFAVIENIILLMFHIYLKLKKDLYFYFIDEKFSISIRTVYKALRIYTLKAVKKIISLVFFSFPFVAVLILILNLLQQGISQLVLFTFLLSDTILMVVGLYSYAVYVQKYQLTVFSLIKNHDKNVKEHFTFSATIMNGKCKNLLKLKIINFPKKLFCLFVIPAFYYLPYCKTIEADYILQKEKPYMRRKAYTEKPIVFYFEPIKEN